MHAQPAGWVEAIAWLSLSLAFASAAIIAYDIGVRGYGQKMWIMNVVYPVTALYWGPFAVWFYFSRGRRQSKPVIAEHGDPDGDAMPTWSLQSKAISHCGAGCTLGDIAGEWVVFSLALTVGGRELFADLPMDFVWAWTLGIAFQYFTIVPMRDIGRFRGAWAAIKVDTLSIVAFQTGLFAGMAVYQLLLWDPPLSKTTATYWLMMQLSMILGFFTAWPVNAWLIRQGLKEKM